MNKESFDPDDPTSVAAAGGPPRETMDEFADTASSTTTGANAGAAGAGSDDEGEDDMPDYRLLAAFARNNKSGAATDDASSGSAFIPKRGEKDFEPTGHATQSGALSASRAALFSAIRGERRINSKALSLAAWDADANRAVVRFAKGQLFNSMGVTVRLPEKSEDGTKEKVESRLELLPEEALYLIERGALECYVPRSTTSEMDEQREAPMSVQQAFAVMLGADGLTRDRYQVYAYLKRLGYIVQRTHNPRSSLSPSAPPSSHAQGIIADPTRPLPLRTLFDLALYLPRRVGQLIRSAIDSVIGWLRALIGRVFAGRGGNAAGGRGARARGTGLLGAQRWDSYDHIFADLQIVPSGHSTTLTRTPSSAPSIALSASKRTNAASGRERLEIFYYAWRPATHFRKSAPPPPEFRIVVIDARKTSLPDMYQFAELFDAVPLPAPAATGQQQTRSQHPATRAPPRQVAQRNASAAQEGKGGAQKTEVGFKKTENEPQTLVAATLNRVWTSLDAVGTVFAHLPPGCSGVFQSTSGTGTRPPYAGPRAPNPFPPLKSGRRNVILAVVDNGTTSLLRFGEAEFAKWRLAGENGPGWGT